MKNAIALLAIGVIIFLTATCLMQQGALHKANIRLANATCPKESFQEKLLIREPSKNIEYRFIPIQCGKENTIARKFNNPFNIKRKVDGGKWQGEIGHDKYGHVHFLSVEYGIRAAAFVLSSYYRKHEINTLESIIKRFCGGNKKYVSYLAKRMKLKPNEKFNVINRMPELLKHMAKYESGKHLPDKCLVTLDVLQNL